MCDCDVDYRCHQHDPLEDMHNFLKGIEDIDVIVIDVPA